MNAVYKYLVLICISSVENRLTKHPEYCSRKAQNCGTRNPFLLFIEF